ncbi:hypothetical protein P5Y53_08730 [Dyella jiangningensis]|uniref:hypothetical protein n=1 Tax=Dyella jiangningensis TaxID=1379159 RepID=UPI0024108387|nr:hypothetical protein [Dyella jiangningensis]MDG2537743.1 hypothetical protein [Dyella jiangningensis]
MNYETIKAWSLDSYFTFCRDRGAVRKMTQLEVLGYVYDDFQDSYERPIERLMFLVVMLVLSGGWHEEFEKNIRRKIAVELDGRDVGQLVSGITTDEVEVFTHDLRVLNVFEFHCGTDEN